MASAQDKSINLVKELQTLVILYALREYHTDPAAFMAKTPLVQLFAENALKFDLSTDNRRFFTIKYNEVCSNFKRCCLVIV